MSACPNGPKASALSSRPRILIAPAYEDYPPSLESPEKMPPMDMVPDIMVEGIIAAGGLPVTSPITDDDALIEELVGLADGIAVVGGQDVDPALWGETEPWTKTPLCPKRDAFEMKLIPATIRARKPLLCICRGIQIMNVALGGTLCMDVPGMTPPDGMALWRHAPNLWTAAHPVRALEGSALSRAMGGATEVQANSYHHCCVDRLGEGLALVTRATDGVPEGIEMPGERFCIGVQWHPECTWNVIPTDFALLQDFIRAARGE